MQSGSSLCLWALTRRARQLAFAVGKLLGISASNSTELLNELLKVNAKKLLITGNLGAILDLVVINPLQGLTIGSVKEPEHEGALFTRLSHQLISQGKYHQVPTIVGHTSQEAVVVYGIPEIFKLYLIKYDLVNADLAPIDMNISNSSERLEVGGKIKQHYFGSLAIFLQVMNAIQFVSDDQFNRPTSELVRLLSKNVATYFYVFSYKGALGSANRSVPGVGHGEELPYLLFPPVNKPTPFDIVVSSRLCRLWTNFAKYGNPTPKRDPFLQNATWQTSNILNSENLVYLDIGSNLTLRVNPNKKNLDFYQNLYDHYGNPPYDTY